jgi:glucose-1-phosphate adenylyltransferase
MSPPDRRRILALVLAGGAGNRMGVLTEARAKPALPFAGAYRLIDFPLSNCVHSRIRDVWVIEQFEPHLLNDHLVNGRPWDLDRTYGGLRIMPPYSATGGTRISKGNADAIYQNREAIRRFAPDLILVLSADHVYRLDYRDVIECHESHDATVTMVTTRVPPDEASRFGNVTIADDGHVSAFAYKPEHPTTDVATAEVFVYEPAALLGTLDQIAAAADDDEDGPRLGDYGHALLPRLVAGGGAWAYPLDGYWRDVGVIDSYWRAHMDLTGEGARLDPDDAEWPVLTFGTQRMPARVSASARLDAALIAPGCEIRGTVERSVLSPGVLVEEGAIVRDSVIFHDVVIRAGATVDASIVDSRVVIGREAVVGAPPSTGSAPTITVIGQGARLADGAQIAAGSSISPAPDDGTRAGRRGGAGPA